MIVVICCGGKKAAKPMPAAEMYLGRYFKCCLSYARSIVKEKDIYIMSAKYGFMRTSKVIAPYNTTLDKAESLTANMLQQQARAQGLDVSNLLKADINNKFLGQEIATKTEETVTLIIVYADKTVTSLQYPLSKAQSLVDER